MSQGGTNLSQDVEGGSSLGAAGPVSSGSVFSTAKPSMGIVSVGLKMASPTMSPPEDVEGTQDDATSSLEAINGVLNSGSTSDSGSVKLAGKDINGGSKSACPAINPPQVGSGAISPLEAMLEAVGLATTASSNSISSSDSVKLAGEDINGGSKPASPSADHASENKARSNPASPVVVYPIEKNNGGSKPASPTVILCAGESSKGEGKDELAGGEGDDAAGDSGGMAGSNSKLISSSSDGDAQDDAKDAPKRKATGSGGSTNSGKDKGKRAAEEMSHKVHIWTERERRKKMKNMYSALHSLLPRLPDKADKVTIVGEAMDYIKTLEGTVQKLEKLKAERMRAQQLGAGSSAALAPPMRHGTPAQATWESLLADMVHNWNAQQAAAAAERGTVALPLGPFQSWSAPNISVTVTGKDAFISIRVPRQSSVLIKVLHVLEKCHIDVMTIHISSNQNQSLFGIHAQINAAPARFPENIMTAEDRFKLAVSEMLQWIIK